MKEFSIEEKAKAYDKAKLRMSAAYNSNRCTLGFMNEIFPELKESEDERIRKALIKLVKKAGEGYENVIDGVSIENAISWLEKQGEQKPTNTVEPRFKINDKVIHKETGKTWTIHWYLADTNSYYVIDEEELINHYSEDVLESAEQKPAEWSEEDEMMIKFALTYFRKAGATEDSDIIKWLKSLKDRVQVQSQWKPCDYELEVLRLAAEKDGTCLMGLYEQLKKLREE